MIRRIPRSELAGRSEPLFASPVSGADPRAPADETLAAQRPAIARALTLLLSEELRLSPEHIERVLTRELARMRRGREIVVRIHPDDLALLQPSAHYAQVLELAGQLSFAADPTISRGGCTLSSNLGEVDATLETRLSLVLTLLQQGALV
jgi:flagellar biosynthesis/type III secretory pathway protein FliH